MRLITSIFFFIFSVTVYADFPYAVVENFRGSYQDPEGTARADKFEVGEASNNVSNLEVIMRVFKEADGYRFSYEGQDFLFQDPPSLIYDVDKLTWWETEIKSQGKSASFKMEQLFTESEAGRMEIKAVEAKCDEGESLAIDFLDKFIDGCLTNSKLSVDSFYTRSNGSKQVNALNHQETLSQEFKQALNSIFLKQTESRVKAVAQEMEIKNLSMKASDHDFELKMTMSGTPSIKAKGISHYLVEERTIRLEIKEVRAGWFGITGKFFDELEKIQHTRLRVERPFIYLDVTRE